MTDITYFRAWLGCHLNHQPHVVRLFVWLFVRILSWYNHIFDIKGGFCFGLAPTFAMKYEIDPDFQACVKQTFQELGIPSDRPRPRFPRGDVLSRRQGASFAKVVLALEPEVPQIIKTRYTIPTEDGYELRVFGYRKEKNLSSLALQPAVLYIHGGGMIFGSAELFEPTTKADVAETGVAHFSV